MKISTSGNNEIVILNPPRTRTRYLYGHFYLHGVFFSQMLYFIYHAGKEIVITERIQNY